jgi:hypothetical protein
MTTHKISPSWKIHFSLTRTHAAKRQASDLLLLSARNAAHDTTPRVVERLPFNPPNKPNLDNVGKFTWKLGECAFEKGVEKIFIYNQLGHAMATAETEDEADDMVYRLNNPTPRDAGVRRFARLGFRTLPDESEATDVT